MTPKEKEAMLGTIEKLMNLYAAQCFWTKLKDLSYDNIKTTLVRQYANDYPCVVWAWEGESIVVTDFIQKEI